VSGKHSKSRLSLWNKKNRVKEGDFRPNSLHSAFQMGSEMQFLQKKSNRLTPSRGFGQFETLECRQVLAANAMQIIADAFPGEQHDFGPQMVSTYDIPDITQAGEQGVKRIVNGEQTNDFAAVGLFDGVCTGTLIGSKFVLTAAHCVEAQGGGFIGDRSATFEVGGQTYNSEKIYVHPNYDPNNFDAGNDLAIVELRQEVVGVDPMEIMRTRPNVGMIMTLVGFGEGGTSRDGYDPNDNGKQAGDTELERVTNTHLWWNFDSHNEANTAPGDSGGPAIITVGGVRYVAGVTSGGTGDAHRLGDQSFDTRVDVHTEWIDGIVGDGGNGGGGTQDDHVDQVGDDATAINLNRNDKGVGRGTFEEAGDRDVFKVNFDSAGKATFRLTETSGDADVYLRIYDASGNLVATNDNFGNSTNSRVAMDVDAGEYFVSAGSFQDADTGNFRVNIVFDADNDGNGNSKTFTNNTKMNIASDRVDRVVSKIHVSGMNGSVSDINVQVDIDHTWTEDLRLVLISPTGKKVLLSRFQGEDGDDYRNTIFDDEAAKSIRQADAPFRGTYKPMQTLSKMDGIAPNGVWKLVVQDTFEEDGGSLNNWKLTVNTENSRKGVRQVTTNSENTRLSFTQSNNRYSSSLEVANPAVYQVDMLNAGLFRANVADFGGMDSRLSIFNHRGDLIRTGSDLAFGSSVRDSLDAGAYFVVVGAADVNETHEYGQEFNLVMKSNDGFLSSKIAEQSEQLIEVLDKIFENNDWLQ
jgi:subtilisin-like proprotein convertase family protein